MTIHKEGFKSIAISAILFGLINVLSFYFLSHNYLLVSWIIFIGTLALLLKRRAPHACMTGIASRIGTPPRSRWRPPP